MARISNSERLRYEERVKDYRQTIEELLLREKETVVLIHQESEGAGLKRLDLVDAMLNLVSNYMIINGISQAVLGIKNEDSLNDARKSLYKSVIYLEEAVSDYVDAPFSDYEGRLEEIELVSTAQRYLLIRKMGLTIQLLENAYGDNSKWRWSFVELEGRFAVVAKNSMNLRKAVANTDPRSPDYEPTVYHLRLIKKLMTQAADRYRERYELSTGNIEDFKRGIRFLSALRRLYMALGDREEAETAKKKLDIWTAKLEADAKKGAENISKNGQSEDEG
jgi:hypothetical protein